MPNDNPQKPEARRLFPTTGFRNVLFALLLSTAVCGVMLLSRHWYVSHLRFSDISGLLGSVFILWEYIEEIRFSGFFGNLLLAWIPVMLAWFLIKLEATPKKGLFWLCAITWVLFFPNSNYIITDIIHVKKFGADFVPKWFDFLMTMSHACTGLFLGCFSLYMLQNLVNARMGKRTGWYFSITMLSLAAFGIFLGRFFRLNSWDIITRPQKMIQETSRLLKEETFAEMLAFTVTFFLFSIAAYCVFVSIARIHNEETADKSE